MVERVHRYKEKTPLFEGFGVDAEIRSTLNRRVDLPSGGYLIFDYAEAFTVIDVNTGRFVGSRSKNSGGRLEDTITKNNLEAVKEVVRQLRLRDIGGIIVIDFIDMANPKNRATVEEALRNELERDRTKTYVVEISPLGLVEMTRQNVTDGPREIMTRKCPTCAGDGIVVSEATAAVEVERRLRTLAAGSRAKAFKVELQPEDVSLLLGPGGSRLAEIEETTKRRFFLAPKEGVHLDHFAVARRGQARRAAAAGAGRRGRELELKLGEVGARPGAAVGKVDGIDVVVAGAAKLVGKKVKVRVDRVLDGVAYASALNGASRRAEPITAESEAEKPTRAPAGQEGGRGRRARGRGRGGRGAEAERRGRGRGARRPIEDEAEEVDRGAAADGRGHARKKQTRRGSRGGRSRKKKPAGGGRRGEAAAEEPRRGRPRTPTAPPRRLAADPRARFELGDEQPARKRPYASPGSRRRPPRRARRRGRRARRSGYGGLDTDACGIRAAEEEDASRLTRWPEPQEALGAVAAGAADGR